MSCSASRAEQLVEVPVESVQKHLNMASTAKRNAPFRAEQLGSLLRPDDLIKTRYAVAEGKAPASELVPLEDQAIKDIVKLQQECGIRPISDGEFDALLDCLSHFEWQKRE